MPKRKSYTFNPGGNDLRRVLYYYGIVDEEQIVCPFHNDHRPSCHINYDDGMFHCYACQASGNAFQFVSLANPKLNDLNKLILYHAILNSKKVSKLKLSKQRASKGKKEREQDRENQLEIAQDYYFGLKTIDWREDDSIHKEYMLKRGFNNRALNLCKAKLTYTNGNYPIIFPIFDNGTFKGSVCRTTNKRIEQKANKYLYNKGFSRVDTLAGDYKGKVVVLCEGYMDHLKLKQFGLKNVAAILGWKITAKQVEKLRANGVETIISALDVDKPGRKGTEYLKNFFDVIEFQFPKYLKDKNGKYILDENWDKIMIKDPGDLNRWQFEKAYKKTKALYRRRIKNVNS